MSLDYDLTDIEDRAVHFPGDAAGKMNDELHVLIFATMSVEMGHLGTDEDVREFWLRLDLWQKVVGPLFQRGNPDWVEGHENPGLSPWVGIFITAEHVQHAKGLRTNVANAPRSEFLAKIAKIHFA